MKRLKLYFLSLLIGLSATFTLPSHAQNKTTPLIYHVEIIIFSHLIADSLNAEQWPSIDPSRPNLSQSIALIPFTSSTSATNPQTSNDTNNNTNNNMLNYLQLPQQDFALNKLANKINQTPHYQVLLHIAWQQTLPNFAQAKPIHLYGGYAYNNAGTPILFNPNDNAPYSSQSNWQINGTLILSVKRFIQANLNLLFMTPTQQLKSIINIKTLQNTLGNFTYFRLLQSRRMRSKELNYIGHPLYGILLEILPEPPQPSSQANKND